MIRYPYTLAELEDEIRAESPRWLGQAATRTATFAAARGYRDPSTPSGAPPTPNWSEVKPFLLKRQFGKCAYCERKLGDGRHILVEWDLEHYRPKGGVKEWPAQGLRLEHPELDYPFPTGGSSASGYYWLAYDLRNYAVACKACNTGFKLDFFPIAGARSAPLGDRAALSAEEPYLLFPVGEWSEDPQAFLTFDGIIPVPVGADARSDRRARVTIDFFRLEAREELRYEQSEILRNLWIAWRSRNADEVELAIFMSETIQDMQRDSSRHAACAQAFVRLCQTDEARAEALARMAHEYLMSTHARPI